MRAQWKKPTLVVLSRGNPEEMVLKGCKGVHTEPVLPALGQQKCDSRHDVTANCMACQPESGKGS
jgi:hypothetical protein